MAKTPIRQAFASGEGERLFVAPLAPLQRKQRRRPRGPTGIQSFETGLDVLKTLVAASGPMKLTQLARETHMSPSKAHRYMVSLCRTGFLAREAGAGYKLGPYALEMAVACLNSLHPVRLASQVLQAISREACLTVAIAAWGNHGPAIVRIEESSQAVSMNVRAGTVVPLTRSASGLVFAAFLPEHVVGPFLSAELRAFAARRRPAARKELAQALDRVRRTGVAAVAQKLVPGTDAIAVPIFDHRGVVVLALLAVGTTGSFTLEPRGHVAEILKRYARGLSNELGYPHAE